MRGAPEDDADGHGLVLGLVDEEEEDLGLAVLFGAVPVRLGGVPRNGSGRGVLLGFHFGVALEGVLVGVQVRLVEVGVLPVVGRGVPVVVLLVFEVLEELLW